MKKAKYNCVSRYMIAFLFLIFNSSITMAQESSSGFADALGDGMSATTGGVNGTAVTVTNYNDLKTQCGSSSTLVITVEGTITGSSAIPVKSNKTILGKEGISKLQGFGLDMNGVSNIIIRDLKITGAIDGIAARNTHHLWVDHCEIWDCGDGLCDITKASSYCTVSWCKFYYVNQTDHRLACLIGAGGGTQPADWGKNKVTYHHNWFGNKVDQRMPRLMYGQGHVYNNYYTCAGNGYCIGVGSYGMALIENNYFKGVRDPHEFMYDVYCHITARGNAYDNCTGNKHTGLGGSRKETDQDFDVVAFATAPYSYSLDNVEDIPTIVGNGAGPRINLDTVAVTGVTVSPNSTIVGIGGTTQLAAYVVPSNASNKKVTWNSSDTSVVTVNSSGLITGVAHGSATITVTSEDGGFIATSDVTVSIVAVSGVSVSPTNASVIIGNTTQFTNTVSPSSASNRTVSWSSSNTAVATVNSTGVVTGVAEGSATITVTTQDGGFMATATIAVSNDPLDGYVFIANEKQTFTYTGIVNIAYGANGSYKYLYNQSSGSCGCNSTVFGGDPIYGVEKKCYVQAVGSVSVKDVSQIPASASIFQTYPNPVSGHLKITLNNESAVGATIQLFDNTGRVIISIKATSMENAIDMGSLPSGLYLIKVSDVGQSIVKHIVKK